MQVCVGSKLSLAIVKEILCYKIKIFYRKKPQKSLMDQQSHSRWDSPSEWLVSILQVNWGWGQEIPIERAWQRQKPLSTFMCCAFRKTWTSLNGLEIWKACQEKRVVLHPVTNLPPLEKTLRASCPLYPCPLVVVDRFWVKRLLLHPGQVAFAGPVMSTYLISKEIRNQNDLFFSELSLSCPTLMFIALWARTAIS